MDQGKRLMFMFFNNCRLFVIRLVLVSTLDGNLSAVNSTGSLIWQINTGPGPLLLSNIHKLEVKASRV